MFVCEDSDTQVPHFEGNESIENLIEMRQQAIAIFYGWGMPIL